MKAIVYDGIQKVQCREVPDPKIEKDDDIIVKVTSTAICGSDLHLVHGLVKGMYDGFVLGHETMGIVEEVGKEVTNLKKGDTILAADNKEVSSIEDFIKSLKSEESEVLGFKSFRVASLEDIEKIPLAFESARVTLKKFLEK